MLKFFLHRNYTRSKKTKFWNTCMKSQILIFLLANTFKISLGLETPSSRIVGGTLTNIARARFLVNLRLNGRFICGGTLISQLHVVTAAHCVHGTSATSLTVTGGATYLSEIGTRRTVQKMYIPRVYQTKTLHADVAVLKLSASMNDANVVPIGLCNANWSVGETVEVFGWGQTKENDYHPSNQLRSVLVKLIARKSCTRQYQNSATITNTMFCATVPGLKDACDGDSGGPVIYKNRLCGIVSWGIGCARQNYPGVYTNVRIVEKFIKDSIAK